MGVVVKYSSHARKAKGGKSPSSSVPHNTKISYLTVSNFPGRSVVGVVESILLSIRADRYSFLPCSTRSEMRLEPRDTIADSLPGSSTTFSTAPMFVNSFVMAPMVALPEGSYKPIVSTSLSQHQLANRTRSSRPEPIIAGAFGRFRSA